LPTIILSIEHKNSTKKNYDKYHHFRNGYVSKHTIVTLITIFYIYKLYPDNINPTAALLGSKLHANAGTAKDEIWGWVSYLKLTSWDHRVAILPSTDEKALEDRKLMNSPALIFCDQVEAKKYKDQLDYSKNCVFWQ